MLEVEDLVGSCIQAKNNGNKKFVRDVGVHMVRLIMLVGACVSSDHGRDGDE